MKLKNKDRKICVYNNGTPASIETTEILEKKLIANNFTIEKNFKDAELIISVGGDGCTLRAIHQFNFPDVPIIGVNTGHLGFYQEVSAHNLDDFIFNYKSNNFSIQELNTVKATIRTRDGNVSELIGLNEIVVRGENTHPAHYNISIGGSFIERFSGDGLVIATSAGSTAYNYSLGGSIVDPRLNLLQVTPIAPMNSTAFRSFTSSILLPSDLSLELLPETNGYAPTTFIFADGMHKEFKYVESILVELSDKTVKLMRLSDYDFWDKVKSKFL